MGLVDIDEKVTAVAKKALASGDGWLTTIVLLIWGMWLSYELAKLSKQAQEQQLAAAMARLDAMQAEYHARVAGIDEKIAEARVQVNVANQNYIQTERRIVDELAAAVEVKNRIARMKTWEELDALSKGE